MLIWVEGDADFVHEPAAGQHRGMMVVAHGTGQGTTGGFFIISYPVDTNDDGPQLGAVSGVLNAMSWSVLALRRWGTAGDQVEAWVYEGGAGDDVMS